MISISVLCCEQLLSICTLGSTVIFGLCNPGLNFVSMSSTTSISPETASASFRLSRSTSEGLSSSVRNRSENRMRIKHHAGLVGKSLGLQDIHSPG